jgi:hypothetical protein
MGMKQLEQTGHSASGEGHPGYSNMKGPGQLEHGMLQSRVAYPAVSDATLTCGLAVLQLGALTYTVTSSTLVPVPTAPQLQRLSARKVHKQTHVRQQHTQPLAVV